MLLRQFLTATVLATTLTGCASAPQVSPAPQPENDLKVTVYPTLKRWTGTLNPTQSYDATAVASRRQNAYGRVELTVSPSSPTLTRVTLTVSVPIGPGTDIIGWGLSPGRCGSGAPPVLPPSTFPSIQLSANRQGNIDVKIPFIIPDKGSYHLNVFRGSGTQLTDVITCADLRRES